MFGYSFIAKLILKVLPDWFGYEYFCGNQSKNPFAKSGFIPRPMEDIGTA